MLNVWTKPSGYDFSDIIGGESLIERRSINLELPTIIDITGITFTVISGNLPKGLRLVNNTIVGSPLEVSTTTKSTFVIRAANTLGQISDRTFSLSVEGADAPQWVTPAGLLPVSSNNLTFILDNSYVDFQLQAIDTDLTAGDSLEYFIAEGDGELPPGLTLSTSGRITGIVDPILALDISARTGFYDSNLFDAYAYDFGAKPNIGIEDYYGVVTPRKLNRNYEFQVTVTDGETSSYRIFRIFVVGDDFLRADNMLMPVGTNAFTADNTYLRPIIWLSANNLGVRRANNYTSIPLKSFDPNPDIGPVVFKLESVNDDLSPSRLPDGLFIDSTNGEIFGFIPYQTAVTKEYKFTVNAVKYDKENLTEVEVTIVVANDAVYGQNYLEILQLPTEDVSLLVGDTIRIGPSFYYVKNYVAPPLGSTVARLNLDRNLLTDVYDGTIIRNNYYLSSDEYVIQNSKKTFVIGVLGEVDSVIRFTTQEELGSIKPNFPSTFNIEATSSVPNAKLKYTLVNGQLPPGLELSLDGYIIGKINQFREGSVSGFTIFDNGTTTFDGLTTTVDRGYRFTVKVEDQFKFSAVTKQFVIYVSGDAKTLYSNIYAKPLQKVEKRELFFNFINDTSVFEPEKIYRLGDPEYGLQTDLKMLIYAGIESLEVEKYIAAISKNTHKKRLKLGEIKKAVAKYQGTNDIVYEVIYIDVLDDYSKSTRRLKLPTSSDSPVLINQATRNGIEGPLGTIDNVTKELTYSSAAVEEKLNKDYIDRFVPSSTTMTIDSKNMNISGVDLEYIYPSSINNSRKNIGEVGSTENEFLPLWMTTPQDNRTAATGFVTAIPLCYCKPGEGDYILANINNFIEKTGFDLKQIDYELDRFIIDSDINKVQEQYLKFANYRYNV